MIDEKEREEFKKKWMKPVLIDGFGNITIEYDGNHFCLEGNFYEECKVKIYLETNTLEAISQYEKEIKKDIRKLYGEIND